MQEHLILSLHYIWSELLNFFTSFISVVHVGLLALFCSSLKSMDAFALHGMIAISAQDLSQENWETGKPWEHLKGLVCVSFECIYSFTMLYIVIMTS